MGSDAYFQGRTVGRAEADNFGSNWTADELVFLRDKWRWMPLSEMAERLGRTETACQSMYYHQLNRPSELRWKPSDRHVAAWQGDERAVVDSRPVRTIHEDEDRWWDPEYYKRKHAV